MDSYTYNIPNFVKNAIDNYEIDVFFDIQPYKKLTRDSVLRVTSSYHGVILSPGPGTVERPEDLGEFTPALLAHRPAVPVFGICFGFQAICSTFGCSIAKLSFPHHGVVSDLIGIDGSTLGHSATRYHSLEVVPDVLALENLKFTAGARNFGDSNSLCLMEVKHRTLPFWGVQYHPESIYSSNCHSFIKPFLVEACRNKLTRLQFTPSLLNSHSAPALIQQPSLETLQKPRQLVYWQQKQLNVDLLDIIRSGKSEDQDFILLDSAGKADWTILTLAGTVQNFRYSLQTGICHLECTNKKTHEEKKATLETVWQWLGKVSSEKEYYGGPADVPFLGGFIGYFSYELGLAFLGLDPYQGCCVNSPTADDIQLYWSTETVLHHKPSGTITVISLRDLSFVKELFRSLESVANESSKSNDIPPTVHPLIKHPEKSSYVDKITRSKKDIRRGNSYELCLTAPTIVNYPTPSATTSDGDFLDSNQLFSHLRKSNPAAFSSYMRLNQTTVISSSPEQFLNFSPDARQATMKPVKGTVPKYTSSSSHPLTHAEASAQLQTPKYIGENLMIVDLIRNDLSHLSSNVTCPQLMEVEELQNLFQMSSTITAKVNDDVTAWDLLKHTLPPGSMTGAPKYRSCQILQCLESEYGSYRGVYSGVIGYIDVRGHSQTSVSIRNAVCHENEGFWRVHAGGAITAMSDEDEEWEERMLKTKRVLDIFQPSFEILETLLWNGEANGPDSTTEPQIRYLNEHFERLMKTAKYFQFPLPLQSSSELEGFIKARLTSEQKRSNQRISLSLSPTNVISLRTLPITMNPTHTEMPIYLDPSSTPILPKLTPFITHKTTYRTHYETPRVRANAGPPPTEVLLFSPGEDKNNSDNDNDYENKNENDILTEGSYTNVAVYKHSKWVTPSENCLKGIEREKLLEKRDIVEGTVLRKDFCVGMRVMLFNSVRGVFWGKVVV